MPALPWTWEGIDSQVGRKRISWNLEASLQVQARLSVELHLYSYKGRTGCFRCQGHSLRGHPHCRFSQLGDQPTRVDYAGKARYQLLVYLLQMVMGYGLGRSLRIAALHLLQAWSRGLCGYRLWEAEPVLLVEPYFCKGIQRSRPDERVSKGSGEVSSLGGYHQLSEISPSPPSKWRIWLHKEHD